MRKPMEVAQGAAVPSSPKLCAALLLMLAPTGADAAYIDLATSVHRDSGQVDGVTEMERRVFNSNGLSEVMFNGQYSTRREVLTANSLFALGEHGSSYSYVDLASGKLGGLAQTTKPGCTGCDYSVAFARASFQEDLVFRVAGAAPGEFTPIAFSINVHGNSTPASGFGYDYKAGTASFGGQFGFGRFEADATRASFNTQSGFVRSYISGDGDIHSYNFIYNLRGPEDRLSFALVLNLSSTNTAFSDYANTASITFDLPESVTFTSSSGVFLSNVGAVPEPSTWALMIGGFGIVGGAMRRSSGTAKVSFA